MLQSIGIVSFVYICITINYAQILYECNFDAATIGNNCLNGEGAYGLIIDEKISNAASEPPTAPLSDVTSSLKPTNNGQSCKLPYKVNPYTWDMYFCNNGYCETSTDLNSICTPGKFGHFGFFAPRLVTFTLNTAWGGTNGTDQQCLTYYYYLRNINGTQQNIRVRKQEAGGSSETIDSVTNSSFNGWIKQQVSFSTVKPDYKISFDFEKISGVNFPQSIIAIDEISIHLGNCFNEPVTQTTSTVTTTINSITETPTVQMTTITTTKPSTIMTTTMILTTTITTTPTTILTSTIIKPDSPSTTPNVISDTSLPTVTSNITSIGLSAFTSMTSYFDISTISSTSNNQTDTVPNNTYIVILITVVPAVFITTIGIAIWIKRCFPTSKISPSAFELSQMAPPLSQT